MAGSAQPAQAQSRIKAVLFDFMGTCLDWHTSITSVLPDSLAPKTRSDFALEWRQAYFDANAETLRSGSAYEDFDVTTRRTLDQVLQWEKYAGIRDQFSQVVRDRAVVAWHHQTAWDEVAEAIRKLKEERGWEVFVHANGTTRLQLDLVRSAGLNFDMLFSSELLGVYKPAPENYAKVLKLLKYKPEECVLVAAHAYDVRGGKKAGMKTVYIYRWTDDIDEDQEKLKTEFDAYLMNMNGLDEVIARL